MKSFAAVILTCVLALRAWGDTETNATPATVGGTASFTVTANGSAPLSYQWHFNGTNAGAVKNVVTIALDSGTVTAPLVWTNGVLSQPDTTDLAGGGKATFNFTVAAEGDYVIAAQVSAPGEDANSFYVNVDASPEDPGMIWDIVDVTEGFQERIVSWRGNGEADRDEFTPKKFHLSAGAHKLFVVGREPAQLKSLALRAP